MLHAFVDDSGDAGSKLYLAAYVHTTDKWDAFVPDWDAALAASPTIDFFHMAEAASRSAANYSDQFRNFTDQERERKVLAMAKVIYKHRPWAFHAVVDEGRYRKIVSSSDVPNPVKDPYFALVFALISGLAQFHETVRIEEPCRFIIDKRDGLKEKIDPFFDIIIDNGEDQPWKKLISGHPTFEDDKEFKPLQAADLLAWHVRRKDRGDYPREFRFLADLLTLKDCHYFREIDDNFMEALAKGARELEISKYGLDSKDGWRRYLSAIQGAAR